MSSSQNQNNKELSPGMLQALTELFEQLKAILAEINQEAEQQKPSVLTNKILLELVCHEGIVLEAYKDSKGIWTWGVGVTNKSGHGVLRYKDRPQSLKRVIEIYKWLLEAKYLPDVLEAFSGRDLTEEQLAAALSFHYNTGAIEKASWVKSFMLGNPDKAYVEIMNWRSPPEIIPRRKAERDLFFKGEWSNDGMATVYTKVRKPSYTPVWKSAERIDISKELE